MQQIPVTEAERIQGEDARRVNMLAAIAVAEAVKSTLGPKGMDKMLVDKEKNVALTNSGATILSLMHLRHPAALMFAQLAKTQEKEVGDGTTTAVVLAGELLKKAEKLLDAKVHPSIVVQGYSTALQKSLEFLQEIAAELRSEDLEKLALSALRGKLTSKDAEHVARIAVEAVKLAGSEENVQITYRVGGSLRDTRVVRGVAIDLGKRVHKAMPKRVQNAKILLVATEFEVKKIEGAKISIEHPDYLCAFKTYKERIFRAAIEIIKRSGANVLLCHKNIDEAAMSMLAKEGIVGVRDVEKRAMELLSRATGAKIVANAREVSQDVLGYAALVEEDKIGLEEIMYVTNCKNSNVATILVRGSTEQGVLELKKKFESLVLLLARAARESKVLAGAGACEVALARRLRDFSRTIEGKEQLAVEAFADALESLPKAVIANAGIDAVDAIMSLRAAHENGGLMHGFDVQDKKLKDALEAGIVESLAAKRQALASATEAAIALLRIDDVLLAKGVSRSAPATHAVPSAAPGGKIALPRSEAAMKKWMGI